MPFRGLGLDERRLAGVEALGYTEPTPIQREAIPHILEGRDVVGCAQTGTGKTAAFVLPALQLIGTGPAIRALVVTPTRELAQQIVDVARDIGDRTGQRVAAVYGGVRYDRQLERLRKGVDLLVATPGRLLDLEKRGDIRLGKIEVLVLDEADRMLDMGFWPDVRRILRLLPERRQNLLFSATITDEVMRIVGSTLTDPVAVEVGAKALPVDAIDQALYPVNAIQKADLLTALIRQHDWDRVLVFTRTKERADRLTRTLEKNGVVAVAMHADKAQVKRQQALDGFRNGKHRVLVATDVVSRGIDVEDISHVVNYDMPQDPGHYVHRIGRTARAGRAGTAVSLLASSEMHLLRDIEVYLGNTIRCEDLEGFDYAARAIPNPDRTTKRARRTMYNGGVMRGGRRRHRR